MKNYNEVDLVNGLRQGDTSVLKEIYRIYRPKIFAYLVRLSGSYDIAEDLSSEVWCRVATKSKIIREDTNLGAWLFTIARNLFFSYCRWRNTEDKYAGALARLSFEKSESATPYHKAVVKEQKQLLEKGLSLIGPKYREALILVGIEGFSCPEAAKICEIQEPAMRKRISRAKGLLKQVISEISGLKN